MILFCNFVKNNKIVSQMIEERNIIEIIIRKAIVDHLVKHVKVNPKDDRDRIDILVDEASLEIMKHFDVNFKKFTPKH